MILIKLGPSCATISALAGRLPTRSNVALVVAARPSGARGQFGLLLREQAKQHLPLGLIRLCGEALAEMLDVQPG